MSQVLDKYNFCIEALLCFVLILSLVGIPTTLTTPAFANIPKSVVANGTRRPDAGDSYAALPLSFELNQGQTNDKVKFLARSEGYVLFLTATEAVMALANPDAQIEGLEQLSTTSNYFAGSDPAAWHTNVSSFTRVRYTQVYPGIDMVYYGNQRRLEYDFVVAPGANPDTIQMAFGGIKDFEIDRMGDL